LPFQRDHYPSDWEAISRRIRERDGNCCKWCGVENRALGGRLDGKWHKALPFGDNGLKLRWPRPGEWASCEDSTYPLKIIRIVLTVAHVHDMNPMNVAEDNLAALCQRCHLNHAAATRRGRKAIGDLFIPLTPEEREADAIGSFVEAIRACGEMHKSGERPARGGYFGRDE
jgi:5-methylcytosine-specific restriction endonuclease McrA